MNLDQLVVEMKGTADARPFYPLRVTNIRDELFRFQREVEIDGYEVHLTFTRTTLPSGQQFYQLSISNSEGIPAAIPMPIIQRLKALFVPKGFVIPSVLGNCYQWLEKIG